MQPSSRRNFIFNSAKASLAGLMAFRAISSIAAPRHTLKIDTSFPIKTGFDQEPLPYTYNALEPYIDSQTMDIHYNKHAAAYSKNLKEAAAAEGVDTTRPLEEVLVKISKYSTKMRNNGGGHYNHELFWKCLTPNGIEQPKDKLLAQIQTDFGSLDNLKSQFNDAAKSRFGSGWAWLIFTENKKLLIASTPNQDNTLMDIEDIKGFPLFGLDVWEHAYYLKYQNRRADYIDSFWKILNWDYVQQRFESV
jgi:Fe-Mn family superoxide dismutase